MRITQPIVDKKLNFQVYLEGISVPFSTVNISESEGNFPTASIAFPSSYGALRILPGTIVQIFGPIKNKLGEEYIGLLFEGEVTGIQYQKGASGRIASLVCNSLLSRFYQATLRPMDTLMTNKLRYRISGAPTPTTLDSIKTTEYTGDDPTKAKISATFVNRSQITGGTINNLMSTIKAKQSTRSTMIDSQLENLVVTSRQTLPLQFINLMSKGVVKKGDFLPLVQFFLRYYEVFDPYFGVQSLSYSLTKSIMAFPNYGKVTAFLHNLVLQNMDIRLNLSSNTSLTLWEAIKEFLRITYYTMIAPAAHTEAKVFWGTAEDVKHYLSNRLYFLPSLDNAPPAKFNILFPSQINSFSFQRDMSSEATRVVGELGLPFQTALDGFKGVNVSAVIPQLDSAQDSKYKLHAGMTIEETYRGISPVYEVIEFMMAKAVDQYKTKYEETGTNRELLSSENFGEEDEKSSTYTGGFGTSFEHMIAESYVAHRYGKRLLSINAEWCPYRMTGIPGVVIDEEGPSIVGIVSSINTRITADGNANSTISFRNPRLIFDDEFDGSFQGTVNTDLDNYLVNDFTNDGFLGINKFLYDEEFYGFENVGYNLYTYFTVGRESSVTNPFTQYKNGIYKRFSGNLTSSAWSKNTGDFSILSYLRKKTTATTYKDDVNSFLSDTDTVEIRYSKLLYLAIQELKTKYFKAKNNGALYLASFIASETWRAVITKENYFNMIGIGNLPSVADCKDSTKIFGTAAKVKGLRAYFDDKRAIKTFIDNQTEDLSLQQIQPTSKPEQTGVVDRVDKWLATEQKASASTAALAQEIRGLEAELKLLRKQVRVLDSWLVNSTKTSKSWYEPNYATNVTVSKDAEDGLFNKNLPEGDLMNALEELYGENVLAASRKLRALKITLAAKESGILEKETATAVASTTYSTSTGETLESYTFKPYNITRYAHVKKAFSNYINYDSFMVIKNRTN
jgi:hypothetical protein